MLRRYSDVLKCSSMVLVADTVGELWMRRIGAFFSGLVRYLGERDFRFSE
jgi:hypothetical protein